MAKYLVAIWPIAGHYNPGLALALALRARGHDVAFYTGQRATPAIESEAFTVFPFRRVSESFVDRVFFDTADESGLTHYVQQRRRLRDWIVGMLAEQVADLTEIVREWRPDGLIADWSMWGPYAVVGEAQNVPVAIFQFQAGCFLPGPDVPPAGFGLPPPRSVMTRALAVLVGALVTATTIDLRRTANRVRVAEGLAPLDVPVTEHAGRMPLYLVTSVPGLDYHRRDLPPTVHYVGPCTWDKPRSEPVAGWIAGLGNGRPTVHVSEGTIHSRAPVLLKAAAEGLGGAPVQVVMTTGTHRHAADLGLEPLASNIRVEGWVPHTDLMPRTDVFITTGGAGSVLAALRCGVPLLVVPTEWDKPESARRVVYAGAGLALSLRRCTPARLRTAVERLLAEPSFRERARGLAAEIGRSGGATRAAELVERSLGPKTVGGFTSLPDSDPMLARAAQRAAGSRLS